MTPADRTSALERIVSARRIVIKVGTSLLTNEKDSQGIDRAMIEKLCAEILFLREKGIEVVLVSSGAVGLGRAVLRDFPARPKQAVSVPTADSDSGRLSRKQALAALGQGRLISVYADVFAAAGIPVAQLLLTARDFRDRRAYLNIGHTLQELMAVGALPVVNENDTVSTEELRFGDNDLLSAACASLFHADLLVILTSVEGFLVDGARQPFLLDVTRDVMREARGPSGPGSGGMHTKMRAGQLCLLTGQVLSILPGRHPAPIQSLFRGDDLGTVVAGA
ncbi:MAG: glutamate 5-kinase, partial [Spirochaetia bacterium]|nr:glutamate 5-kinase [Spirochaetia bacterium]